jgi:hypothetical protein
MLWKTSSTASNTIFDLQEILKCKHELTRHHFRKSPPAPLCLSKDRKKIPKRGNRFSGRQAKGGEEGFYNKFFNLSPINMSAL